MNFFMKQIFVCVFLMLGYQIGFSQVAIKQLYLSDPAQALDRIDPVTTFDGTTAQTVTLSTSTTVTVDAVSSITSTNTPITLSHTTGSGLNRLMLVGISQKNRTVTSVTYGGTALTLVGEDISTSEGRIHLYKMVNPPSGTANVVVTFNSNPDKGAIIGIVTFTGVDQTTPLGAFASTTGNSINPSLTLTSAVGELVLDVAAIKNEELVGLGSGQTQRWNRDSNSDIIGGGSTKLGAASTTMTWTATDSDNWAIGAVSIKPATGITNTTFTQSPTLCSGLTIKAGQPITVTNYISPIGSSATATASISASTDDAEEEGPGGVTLGLGGMYLISTDIEFVTDIEAPSCGVQKVGMRFNNLSIPQGAVITNAYLAFKAIDADAPNTNNGATSLTIKGQAADNATTFTSTVNNISTRPTTAASVAWSPAAWTTGTVYNSPDLTPIAQEIVNRPGWSTGNSMVFIVTGTGSRSTDAWDSSPSSTASLVIQYTLSGTMPPNPNITALLKYGGTTIISLTNPTYNSGTNLLTWTGTLGADVTVPAGQAIALQITTAQSGVAFKIDYDSQTKPSKINLPVSTYIDITAVNMYSAAYPGGSIVTTASAGTTVYLRSTVTDPFGTSDITAEEVLITAPGGGTSTVAATSVATAGCVRTYEYPWTVPATSGNYKFKTTAKEGTENTVTDTDSVTFLACTTNAGTFTTPSGCFDSKSSVIITHNNNHLATNTQRYALVNPQGIIMQVGVTPNFGIQAIGDYTVYAVNYPTNGVTNLATGIAIAALVGSPTCYDAKSVSISVCKTVCGKYTSIIQQ